MTTKPSLRLRLGKSTPLIFAAVVILLLAASPAMAQDGAASVTSALNGLDTMWVLIAAFLVFFMQAGFGMVEAGFQIFTTE